ncbi:uncharacterized protein METZ01_LOCUS481769, partial [marine metagenome]
MTNLNYLDLSELTQQFNEQQVIKYVVIDDFVVEDCARQVAKEHVEVPQEYWLDYSHT